MKFCFEEYNVALKMGIVRLLADWHDSDTNSSILYDSKFVQLLVISIFSDDDVLDNKMDKKKMKFIKGEIFFKKISHIISGHPSQIYSNDFE